jgi:Fur family ferric uptake transcriptional regulator
MQRQTRQRQALRRVIGQSEHPLTAGEIQKLAGRSVRGLGLATVYRTIRAMVDAGEVRVVDVPGETPRYESAHKEHHHHFLCRTCERVYEALGCEDGRATLAAPPGFRVEGHEIVLRGVCGTCVDDESTVQRPQKAKALRRARKRRA